MTFNYFSGKALVVWFSLLFFLITFFLGNIPFFWDMSYISKVAVHIYESGFSLIIFPEFDNGYPPLFSIYFAALWTIFGKSLLISHLAIVPFIIILLYQFYKLLKRYVDPRLHIPAFLILLAEPAFVTQFLFTGYDIVICTLVLLSVNSILDKKTTLNTLALAIIPLLSIRGFSFVIALYFFNLFATLEKPFKIRSIIRLSVPYMFSFLFLCLWLFYHYCFSGWSIIAEKNEYIFAVSGLEWFARNLFYIFWKIADSGRVFLYLLILILLFKSHLKPTKSNIREIFVILTLLLLSYIVFFVMLHSQVAQRHFISIYVLSIILFTHLLIKVQKRIRNLLLFLVLILFLSGNFWIYPIRFGNAWDASLKVLPYFKIDNEFHQYIIDQKINPSEVGAQFPMNANRKYTYLEPEYFEFCDIDTKPINKFRYIVHSNICNAFMPSQVELLSKKWILLKQFQSGMVYIKLYKNPDSTESDL